MWVKIKAWLVGAWQSWTIWFNSVFLAISMFSANLETALPMVKEYIPAGAYTALGLLAAINILLRFKTNQSLAEKGA